MARKIHTVEVITSQGGEGPTLIQACCPAAGLETARMLAQGEVPTDERPAGASSSHSVATAWKFYAERQKAAGTTGWMPTGPARTPWGEKNPRHPDNQ